MLTAHQVLRGPDPVTGLQVASGDLSAALERELRGKLLRLRQGYIAHSADPVALGHLAARSAGHGAGPAAGLLVLEDRPVPTDQLQMASTAAAMMGIEGEQLLGVVRHRGERGWRCGTLEFESYLDAVARAARFVDQLSSEISDEALLDGGCRSLAALAMLTAGCGYNQIQTMDEKVNQAQGQIQTQLQRRADLIPNLVNTVKGITKQEDTVFISIANARAKLSGAIQSGNVGEMSAANQRRSPRAWAGCWPSRRTIPSSGPARTSASFRTQLEGTENRIAWRGRTTTPRSASTTPTSGAFPTT